MKHIYSLFLLLCLSFASIANDNVLSNPGFETDLSGWGNGFWGGPVGNITRTTDFAQEGSASLKAEITIADAANPAKGYARYDHLELVEGEEYKLEFYLMSESGESETLGLSIYSDKWTGGDGTAWGEVYVNNDLTFQGNGAWHKMSYEFVAQSSAGTPDFSGLGLSFKFAGKIGVYYLDNLMLAPKNGTIDPPAPIGSSNYYVSVTGDDSAEGTEEAPFRTISKAATLVLPGDTVFIHEGTYNETVVPTNSGTEGKEIVYQACEGEQVVITAMEILSGWEVDNGSIYKTTVDWSLGQENFIMNGATALDLARWPNNTDGDMFTLNSIQKEWGDGSDENAITDAYLTNADIPNMDWSKGGSIFFYGGGGWLAWKSFITKSSSGKVEFTLDKNAGWIRTSHAPNTKGEFYLEGIKDALDYENEWYFDEEQSTLYVQLPNGDAPVDGEVQMRKRKYTIDLKKANYIQIKNIAVFGGSIVMQGNHNRLEGVSSFYGNWTRGVVDGFSSGEQSVYVTGSDNVIEKCEIAFGAGSGIWLAGDRNKILDCNVHDFNLLGCYDAPMMVRNGEYATIKNNNIYRGGRDALQILSRHSEVAYNDISRSNLIANDCGLLYTLGKDLQMEIHHNYFHDAIAREGHYKAAGIYLDNDAADVKVHHNVVTNTSWTSIQINWDGTNIDIINNTLWNGSEAMGAWHKEGTAFDNVKVYNTLTNMNSLEEQSEKKNNLILAEEADPFSDMANGDYTLKSNAQAIDYGIEIAGTTDGFKGNAPDAGAYETGVTPWTTGISWNKYEGPTGNGCYGLPGNNCNLDEDGDGVLNEKDICPDTPAGSTVDENGCTIDPDLDGDGVLNENDQCPDTPEGAEVDENGCMVTPVIDRTEGSIKLYPNPVINDVLKVSLPSDSYNDIQVAVIDITGRTVLENMYCSPTIEMDLASLRKGMYVVTISVDGQFYSEKILKN